MTTPSPVVHGVQLADPACQWNGTAYSGRFGPSANTNGELSRVWTGIAGDGAAYRIEVPPDWNGTLVMIAHGYRGTGNLAWVDDPQLRQYFVDHGFAWAASSYARNGYDVGDGVVDTHDLLQAFPSITGRHARRVIMSGPSMGGEITVAEVETYKGEFAGAMPFCGVLAGNDFFNYMRGVGATAAALTAHAADAANMPAYTQAVLAELPVLGITPDPATAGRSFSTDLTKTGTRWAGTVEQFSGGTRPGFESALDYWDSFGYPPLTQIPFLFGLYPVLTGGTVDGRAGSTEFSFPAIQGDPGIPVLSLHGIGDLFVPFSMDQIYDALMVRHAEGNLFVGRAIREVVHCGYTADELSAGFSALVSWIDTGRRPAGDDILNPRAVASPSFGCRFTDRTPGAHPEFKGLPCPAQSG